MPDKEDNRRTRRRMRSQRRLRRRSLRRHERRSCVSKRSRPPIFSLIFR